MRKDQEKNLDVNLLKVSQYKVDNTILHSSGNVREIGLVRLDASINIKNIILGYQPPWVPKAKQNIYQIMSKVEYFHFQHQVRLSSFKSPCTLAPWSCSIFLHLSTIMVVVMRCTMVVVVGAKM